MTRGAIQLASAVLLFGLPSCAFWDDDSDVVSLHESGEVASLVEVLARCGAAPEAARPRGMLLLDTDVSDDAVDGITEALAASGFVAEYRKGNEAEIADSFGAAAVEARPAGSQPASFVIMMDPALSDEVAESVFEEFSFLFGVSDTALVSSTC